MVSLLCQGILMDAKSDYMVDYSPLGDNIHKVPNSDPYYLTATNTHYHELMS